MTTNPPSFSSLSDSPPDAGAERVTDLPVRFGVRRAQAEGFGDLFSQGMDLVEETAGLLDREARAHKASLCPKTRALYDAEAMRLTTRLMQIASWLLLQRAALDGEMSPRQVLSEKKNIRLDQMGARTVSDHWDNLPEIFIDLVDRSLTLQKRVQYLDKRLYFPRQDAGANGSASGGGANPVGAQYDLLRAAFEAQGGRKSA